MARRNFNSYTNGTSALKMPRWAETADDAKIIMFPGRQTVAMQRKPAAHVQRKAAEAQPASTLKRILESSEMFCSLRSESMMGCPYNLFSKQGIAALSTGAAVIAAISLAFGA